MPAHHTGWARVGMRHARKANGEPVINTVAYSYYCQCEGREKGGDALFGRVCDWAWRVGRFGGGEGLLVTGVLEGGGREGAGGGEGGTSTPSVCMVRERRGFVFGVCVCVRESFGATVVGVDSLVCRHCNCSSAAIFFQLPPST